MGEDTTWVKSASRDTLISGVGCPWCKHEGPYWVEACRLHAVIYDMCEGDQLRRRVIEGYERTLRDLPDKVCNAVSEIDDRTSPDDAPDMMLVTAAELSAIIRNAVEGDI